MRSIRFSIAGLMAMVLLIALGFAALRNASDTVFAILLLVSRGVLGIAIVGGVCCSGARRAFWLGFAISGWIFIWCSVEPYPASPPLPTQTALFALGRAMGVPVDNPVLAHDRALMQTFFRVGQCVWSLIFAAAGGILARLLFGAAAGRAVELAQAPGSRPSRFGHVVVAAVRRDGVRTDDRDDRRNRGCAGDPRIVGRLDLLSDVRGAGNRDDLRVDQPREATAGFSRRRRARSVVLDGGVSAIRVRRVAGPADDAASGRHSAVASDRPE